MPLLSSACVSHVSCQTAWLLARQLERFAEETCGAVMFEETYDAYPGPPQNWTEAEVRARPAHASCDQTSRQTVCLCLLQ